MRVDKETTNWLDMARYDLETANSMLETGRFIYTIFMCHMAIEKILKASLRKSTGETPPKTHDLIYLARKSGIEFDEEGMKFLESINNYHLATRYPEDFQQVSREFDRRKTEEILKETTRIFRWIEKSLK